MASPLRSQGNLEESPDLFIKNETTMWAWGVEGRPASPLTLECPRLAGDRRRPNGSRGPGREEETKDSAR